NTLVFKNLMGGVNVLHNGKIFEVTNLPDAEYEIYGNVVLLRLFNKSFIVFKEGRQFKA
ncbi:MAG: hypothetical protein ACK45H_00515, partial [Bacteroidota bacterium]